MKGRGLFNLFLLFGFLSYFTKLIQARSNVLHDGVLDSMAYDPNLLSMLQMEQSLDLDDDESAYLGTSLLDKSPSFLQQGCSRRGATCNKSGSFLQQTTKSTDDDDEGEDSSFLEDDDDDYNDTEDGESLLESKSSSSSNSSDDDNWAEWSGPSSYLETSSSFTRKLSPSTFGSLIQLHNFETEPLNFLQDDTLLLMNEEPEETDENFESPKKTNVKAYVLKSDVPEPDLEETLDESTAQQLLTTVKAYKVWVVVVVVLLLIAVVVRLYYLDKFLKFKNELWNKLDNFNKAVVGKWNGVFKKNQANTETATETEENAPLLSA